MTWSHWITFVIAAAVLGLVPGPGVLSIIGYAVNAGRRVALASVAGIAIGNAVAMTLSLAGVGMVLATSAFAFTLVKGIGAAYLVALGVLALVRSRASVADGSGRPALSARAAFLANVAVGTFHPKTIMFFVAFAPQFIAPDRAYAPQAALLIATFCAVVASTDTLYAFAAARAAYVLRRPRAIVWSRRVGGGALVAAGIATAAARR